MTTMTKDTSKENLPTETNLQILLVQGGEKANEEAMDAPVEISIEADQAGDSSVEFVSAESSTIEEPEISIQDSLASTAVGSEVVVEDTNESNQQNDAEQGNALEGSRLNHQVPNGHAPQKDVDKPIQPPDNKPSGPDQAPRSKKGPPPGLLPLQPTPLLNGESRSPRQAALKSAERMKIITKLQSSNSASYNEQDVTVMEAAQGITDAEASDVYLLKIQDPSLDICKSCRKLECLLYQTTGRHSKKELKFCNRKCVQAYFKYATLHFSHGRDDDDKDESSSSNGNSQRAGINHIIVEPDIEIQTLSDEFQMDADEANTSVASNGPVTASFLADIDQATRQTLICATCNLCLLGRNDTIQWEAMEFCSDKCLRTQIKVVCYSCNNCGTNVNEQNLGKLCVRFGTVIRQFCTSDCLEKFKGRHKLCMQCQVNMTDKDKAFCSIACQELHRRLANKSAFYSDRTCAVCTLRKPVKFDIYMDRQSHWVCGKPCRNAFRFANKMTTLSCSICTRYFDVKTTPRFLGRVNEKPGGMLWFCTSTCFATHLYRNRKIELCARCQVKKYNVDMIRKPINPKTNSGVDSLFYCSLFCYINNQLPVNVRKRTGGDGGHMAAKTAASTAQPAAPAPPTISLPNQTPQMGNVTIAMAGPKSSQPLLILNNVVLPQQNSAPQAIASGVSQTGTSGGAALPIEVQHKVVTVPPKPKEMKNKAVWCRPVSPSKKSASTQSSEADEQEESSESESKKPIYIPILIPVPIYIPLPMAMYSVPAPFPVGFPVPYPTPVLVPFDASDTEKILKAIEESKADETVQNEQTEPMLIAEVVSLANENTQTPSETQQEHEEPKSEEVEQLKPQSDSDEIMLILPGKDLEKVLPSCSLKRLLFSSRKRSSSTSVAVPAKRFRGESARSSSDTEEMSHQTVKDTLKQEYGMNAWSAWLKLKNSLHQTSDQNERSTDPDDINVNLIGFITHLRKPKGGHYRPDTLLYLLYGMAPNFDLEERKNIFMDSALAPFHQELDKQLRPFYEKVIRVARGEDHAVLTTCLKESHLWDSRQLGVHSPLLLVFTMLYFNTKFFRLYTPEQHELLSFSSIQKLPLKTTGENSVVNGPKTFSRVFYLQYTPKTQESNNEESSKLRKPLNVPQNVDCPPQCPVKLYNFYLSKCPESAKTRQDVFYLMPLESTTPDAVWYSSQAVPREILARMLHRVLLIEEVLRNLCAAE